MVLILIHFCHCLVIIVAPEIPFCVAGCMCVSLNINDPKESMAQFRCRGASENIASSLGYTHTHTHSHTHIHTHTHTVTHTYARTLTTPRAEYKGRTNKELLQEEQSGTSTDRAVSRSI